MPVLMGPTGSGKTSLVSKLDSNVFEIISIDSRQIYKGLEINSAAPEKAELSHIEHHLVSIIEPNEIFDAAMFVNLAHEAIQTILKKGKIPICVGGAGFYFKALYSGGPIFKKADAQIKQRIQNMTPESRLELLFELDANKLANKNEQALSGKIHVNDDYRIGRALEVLLSEKKDNGKEKIIKPSPYKFTGWWLNMDKEEYWKRLELRIDEMIKKGMIEEVQSVFKKHSHCPGLKSLACDDILKYTSGKINMETLKELIFISHRQYGKRQRTWFRNDNILLPIHANEFSKYINTFLKKIGNFQENL